MFFLFCLTSLYLRVLVLCFLGTLITREHPKASSEAKLHSR